jgi:NADPH2:quinone reductase
MVAAVRVHELGGPEVLTYEQVDVGEPGTGQIRLKQHASGVNFIDTYFRTGLYSAPLPFIPGNEGAGEVTAVGPGVSTVKVGDRVAYVNPLNGYSEERLLPADRAVNLPDGISYQQAAGMMLKGMTAHYLLHRTFKVEKGSTILIHAAAGGVGLIVCQWANLLGATVIGTAGSPEKAELARQHGAHHTILYREEDFVARVKDLTKGGLCDVVYDGVGKDVMPASLDCLRPLGMYVNFGNASGPVPPFPLLLLTQKGSLYATRPTLNTHIAKREDLLAISSDLFQVVQSGAVKIPVHHTYQLRDAAQAHRDLEGRKTTGSIVLEP